MKEQTESHSLGTPQKNTKETLIHSERLVYKGT